MGDLKLLLNTFVKYTKTMVNNSVVKFSYKAKDNETIESLRNADEYISALKKADRFDLYNEFRIESIKKANLDKFGYSAFDLANNPELIPKKYRDIVLNYERQAIVDEFIELNDYYRMLNGKPPLAMDSKNFITLTPTQYRLYEIPMGQYIHEMSDISIGRLSAVGIIDELIEKYPQYVYLQYLGENRIEIDYAREANNFTILRINKEDVPNVFYDNFMKIYEECRVYFTTVIYNKDVGSAYPMYDNFIGLCIMIMTIQRMVSNTFKDGIEREFYDWGFIQKLYKTYNLPFIENLSMEYHVLIMKNLNYLLHYKATDKVLYDICSLLGRERVDIQRYYLVKDQVMDENNKPIFYYKVATDDHGDPIRNEDGSYVMIEDFDRMYELYFQPVSLNERNIALAMKDETNRTSYEEMIAEDPYWRHDADLEKLLHSIGINEDKTTFDQPYNYVETKYLNLNIMYNMTEMLFEITYAFNMLMDKKEDIDFIFLTLPKIVADNEFTLFDVIIFLIVLTCKANGFKDSIIMTPTKIANIYANTEEDYRMYSFNFDPDQIESIKNMILEHADVLDQATLEYFRDLTIDTEEEANELFLKIKDYNNFIIEKMRYSNNIKEYHMYKDIFNITMTSEIQKKIFNINHIDDDGNIVSSTAKTYMEYLENHTPVLAEVAKKADIGSISTMIDHIIARINMILPDLQYLFLINENNNPVYQALVALLKFFKSYTVDFTQLNITYLFNSKFFNLVKMVEDVHRFDVYIQPEEHLNAHYFDQIKDILAKLKTKDDILKFNEKYGTFVRISLAEDTLIREELYEIISKMVSKEYMSALYADHISIDKLLSIRNELLTLYDKYKLYYRLTFKDELFEDKMTDVTTDIDKIFDNIFEKDLALIFNKYDVKITLDVVDTFKLYFRIHLNNDMISFNDSYNLHFTIPRSDNSFPGQYSDQFTSATLNRLDKDKFNMRENIFLIYNL